MAKDEDAEKCAKDGLPATTHRWKAGTKQLICGNGHNWTEGTGRRSEQAKAADRQEAAQKALREYFDINMSKFPF